TTVVVLIPFVYLQGELRIYYVPLAMVVGFSLVASLFVAFSFIPALGSRILGTTSWRETGDGGARESRPVSRVAQGTTPPPTPASDHLAAAPADDMAPGEDQAVRQAAGEGAAHPADPSSGANAP